MNKKTIVIIAVVIAVVIIAGIYIGEMMTGSVIGGRASVSVSRAIEKCTINQECEVTLKIKVKGSVENIGVQETLPEGWILVSSEPEAGFSNEEKEMVAWMFGVLGEKVQTREITYNIIPTTKTGRIAGIYTYNDIEKKISGKGSVRVKAN